MPLWLGGALWKRPLAPRFARSCEEAWSFRMRRGPPLIHQGTALNLSSSAAAPISFTKPSASRKRLSWPRTKTAGHPAIFGQERSDPMRLTVKQTECAGKMFWVVRDTDHSWFYHGPFADEATAQAFARAKNSAAWKDVAPGGTDKPKGCSRGRSCSRINAAGTVLAAAPACL